MSENKVELRGWLVGLAVFAVVVAMGIWLRQTSSFGIVDHQIAGSAAQVDTIQAAWRADGVRTLAILAMLGDLVFIGIYSWGSWIAGRSFMAAGGGLVRLIGLIVAAAAVVFFLTDYCETILQFIQLVRERGSDWMAATAATVQPIKVVAWIVTFVGVLLALVVHRFTARSG